MIAWQVTIWIAGCSALVGFGNGVLYGLRRRDRAERRYNKLMAGIRATSLAEHPHPFEEVERRRHARIGEAFVTFEHDATPFPWEDFGLSLSPTVRFAQLSCSNTFAALVWASQGDQALMQHLLECRDEARRRGDTYRNSW